MRSCSLPVAVNNKKYTDNILEMKAFCNLKCKAYPHERLNTSKEVVRNKELSLAIPEEINATLGNQEVTNCRRISTKRGDQQILTHTYILTFNKPSIPKEIKIGFMSERIK